MSPLGSLLVELNGQRLVYLIFMHILGIIYIMNRLPSQREKLKMLERDQNRLLMNAVFEKEDGKADYLLAAAGLMGSLLPSAK